MKTGPMILFNYMMKEKDIEGPWYYEQVDLGYNYRMTDIQAALLISQLDKLEAFSKRRKEIVSKYDSRGAEAVGNIERFAFYDEAKKVYAIISTGESALYANIMLQKGVVVD